MSVQPDGSPAEPSRAAEPSPPAEPSRAAEPSPATGAARPGDARPGNARPGDDARNARRAEDSPRRRRVGLFAVIAVAVLLLDVVSKLLVVANLPPDHPAVRVLGGLIYVQQTRNSGAAFSLGTGFTVILTAVAVVVAAVIVRAAARLRSVGWAISLGLILGGAVGNLIDRFFRSPSVGKGHVVDWISPFAPYGERFAIFNLADSGIVCGALLAAVLALCNVELDGRRTGRHGRQTEPTRPTGDVRGDA